MVQFVSACCHSDSVHFGLLWADVADEGSMGDLAILGDLRLVDEKCGTGAFDLFGDRAFDADAMGKGWPHLVLSPFSQIGAEGLRRSFIRDPSCLLAEGGEAARAAM